MNQAQICIELIITFLIQKCFKLKEFINWHELIEIILCISSSSEIKFQYHPFNNFITS
jgi:hypothetical protein